METWIDRYNKVQSQYEFTRKQLWAEVSKPKPNREIVLSIENTIAKYKQQMLEIAKQGD